jgi:phage anti-repressor protein
MNFLDFIQKFSFVNSQFVKDFYNIIKEDYIENFQEFLIDSEILRKWLKISMRRSFNDTIKRSYRKNIDYKIKKIKREEGSGGSNYEVITLTPEASKKICMSTNSKIGVQVQQYFLDIEVALYKYKNYIIEGMNKKIQQLENNQKPKINSNKKIIYVFRALNTDLTLYKIGKTINSKTRFSKHNSSLANDLEVLFQYETDNIDQVESCIKALMKKAQYRKYKEVYRVDLDIIKKTIKICDAEINEINKEIDKKNKKQKGGGLINKIDDNEILYLLIPHLIAYNEV